MPLRVWSAVSSWVANYAFLVCGLNLLSHLGATGLWRYDHAATGGDGPLANHNIVAQFRLSTKLCVHNAF
jgi:hypothetical protein